MAVVYFVLFKVYLTLFKPYDILFVTTKNIDTYGNTGIKTKEFRP